MKRVRSGFTLVELVVVIATIGILAAITVIGLTRYQADTRDARRAASVGVISEALEKYYDQNGEYPSCTAVMAAGSTLTQETLKGISPSAVKAPQAPSEQSNSIECEALTLDGVDLFEYEGDGSPACLGSVACLKYTLKYKEEGSGQIKTLESRRNTSIATSGGATLTSTGVGFDNVQLSWTAVQNATSYLLQRCSTAGCSGGTIVSYPVPNETTATVNELNTASTYWFRVRPDVNSTSGTWSNTISATTLDLPTPVVVPTPNSNTQITVSWGAISGATTYSIDMSTVSNFGSNVTPYTGLTTTSRVFTGLSPGVQYFFRVKAFNGSFSSDYGTANSYTVLPTPTCSTSTLVSNTQVTPSWEASSGAITYNLQYASNSGFTSPSSIANISGTSQAVTGLNNGTTYYFRVKAVNGSVESAWGNCPSRATGVDGPTSVGWSGRGEAVRCYTCVAWMPGQDPGYGSTWWTVGMYIYGTCKPGATVVTRLYSYYAYSNGSSANDASLMDWTWGNQERHIVSGSDSWYGWFQGWVACQVGSTRAGDTYLGNAGPY